MVVPVRPAISGSSWVRVGLEPKQLALAAGLHYGLPLVGFLAGAALGQAAASGTAYGDFAALGVGLFAFMLAAAIVSRALRPAWNPVVERLSCRDDDTNSSSSE